MTLTGQGFAGVHVVIGGMTAWHKAGWPVEANEGTPPKAPSPVEGTAPAALQE